MTCGFFEIYGSKLIDLLNDRKEVQCLESNNKNHIKGLEEIQVSSVQDIMRIISEGLEKRSSGQTGANDSSSRSHAILQMELKQVRNQQMFSRMSFIDLAGSERGADTMDNDKQTRNEGKEINTSLLALKECIRALDQQKNHV